VIKLFQKLKTKWNIESNWDFFFINVVFALAGSSIGFERKPIFELLGISVETPLWIKICTYIPLIIPLYQVNLIIFSLPFGQFPFFWKKEKQLGKALKRLFQKIFTNIPAEMNTSKKSINN